MGVAVQCDYCGKFAPNPQKSLRFTRSTSLPDGWSFVNAWDGGARDESAMSDEYGEFCSRNCVSAHFARPRATP